MYIYIFFFLAWLAFPTNLWFPSLRILSRIQFKQLIITRGNANDIKRNQTVISTKALFRSTIELNSIETKAATEIDISSEGGDVRITIVVEINSYLLLWGLQEWQGQSMGKYRI